MPPLSLLLALPDGAPSDACTDRLTTGGLTVLGRASCYSLVRDVVRFAPDAVLLVLPELDAAWSQALRLLANTRPMPVVWWGAQRLPGHLDGWDELAELGIGGWWPEPVPAMLAGDALRYAVAAHARHRRLSEGLHEARAALDERKWVDRAKGVLMAHQHLSEDAAFRLLRSASMQANLRLGELSRGLVAMAQAAEVLNRTGQLRMLSQRLVKALAQRHAGVEPQEAEAVALRVMARVEDNLAVIAAAGEVEQWPELAAVRTHWRQLNRACQPGAVIDAAALVRIDALAEALLLSSDALTLALSRAGDRPQLELVNRSGRQRMLAQRLGKQALLAGLVDEASAQRQAAAAAATLDDFEAALGELERAPLCTPEIKAELALARGEWRRLIEAVRRVPTGDQVHTLRRGIVRESDALMDRFERLTTLYEHSMQLLLG